MKFSSSLLQEKKILENIDRFSKKKCNKHDFNLKYICTNSKCIDELNCFLCTECHHSHSSKYHSNYHTDNSISHEIFPYNEVFSLALLEDLKQMITKEDEIMSLCMKENSRVINQLDTIFNTLESDIMKIIRDAKEKLKNKIMGFHSIRQSHKLKEELQIIQNKLFDQNQDDLHQINLKSYLNSYIHIDTQFKFYEKPNTLKEKIMYGLNHSDKDVENLWHESIKLKQACEKFVSNVLFIEVLFYIYFNHIFN